MEANNEQTVITRILYIRNSTTQDRKSENKKRSEKNKQQQPQKLKLIQPANQKHK